MSTPPLPVTPVNVSNPPTLPLLAPAAVAQALFPTPPTLLSAATLLVQGVLDEHYADFELSAERVRLAVPYWSLAQGIEGAPAGYHDYSLGQALVERFAWGVPPLRGAINPRWDTHSLLWRELPSVAGKPLAIDVDELLAYLDVAGKSLLATLKQQLIDTWNQSPDGREPSRWLRLAAALGTSLVPGGTPVPGGRPDLSRLPSRMGYAPTETQVAVPALDIRAYQIRVFSVDAQERRYPEPFPVISFSRYEQGRSTPYHLYFHPKEGSLRTGKADDTDLVAMLIGDVTAGRNLEIRESEVWRWQQPAELIGESLAQGLLEYQLQALSLIESGDGQGPGALQRRVDEITDPRHWFALSERSHDAGRFQVVRQERCGAALTSLNAASLPGWLLSASVTDRSTYSGLLTELARVQCRSQGQHYLDDIDTLNVFAARRLHELMRKDQPQVLGVAEPDDIHLALERTVAVAVSGGAGGAQGTVETVRMSLTELAVANLGGFRHVKMTISIRRGEVEAPVPAWLTPDYIRGLVTRADIGQAYPDRLKSRLITDTVEARRREALFVTQLGASLPLLALEAKIRGESGLSERGFRYVQAVLRPAGAGRWVDGQEIVLRALAFKATADGTADEVRAMFLIGPRDMTQAPVLLYRPLYLRQPLQEFVDYPALLAAIGQSGDLQSSVLTWMTEPARRRYAQGGFAAPHIQSFLPGDEFSPEAQKPEPARLAEGIVTGDYRQAIFAALVKAQVEQADRQAVSNVEQRWADWKQGAWLALLTVTQLPFARLLPYVGRLVGVLGWLVAVKIAHDDLQSMAGGTPQEQSAGAADLLFNLATQLLHYRVAGEAPVAPSHAAETPPVTEGLPTPSIVRMPDAPRLELQPSSFGWLATESLMSRIRPYRFREFGKPLSALSELGEVATSGPARGLVHIKEEGVGRWCALIQGDLYEVAWESQGEDARMVDAYGNAGPWVRSDGKGNWNLDTRLRGGAPPRAPVRGVTQKLEELSRLKTQADAFERRITISQNLWKATSAQVDVSLERYTRFTDDLSNLLEDRLQNYGRQLELVDELKLRTGQIDKKEYVTVLTYNLTDVQSLIQIKARWLIRKMEESSKRPVDPQDMSPHFADLDAEAEGIEQLLNWSARRKELIGRLKKISKTQELFQQILVGTVKGGIEGEERTWKITQLQNRIFRSEIRVEDVGQEMTDAVLKQVERLLLSCRSSLDIIGESELPVSERISLLESIVEQSGDLRQKFEFWSASIEGRAPLTGQLRAILELLERLEKDTQEDLRQLLGQDDWDLPPPLAVRPAPAGTRKRIFRTRQQQLLAGTIQSSGVGGQQTMQVTDGHGQVLKTFGQVGGDDLWDELVVADRPTSPVQGWSRPRPQVDLAALVSEARQLLKDEASKTERVLALAGRTDTPRSDEDILRLFAQEMEDKATKIDELLKVPQDPPRNPERVRAALSVVDDLRQAAPRLREAGKRARVRAIKDNPPQMSRIDYLLGEGEVTIRREGGRTRLARNDFLQEFAVLDQDGQPLWYAHFHYPTGTAADVPFSAGHLKTVAQRKVGGSYQAMAEEEANRKLQTGRGGSAVRALAIHRGKIDPQMAQRHFFPVP